MAPSGSLSLWERVGVRAFLWKILPHPALSRRERVLGQAASFFSDAGTFCPPRASNRHRWQSSHRRESVATGIGATPMTKRIFTLLALVGTMLLSAGPVSARVKLATLPVRERVEIQLDNGGATLVE